MAHRRHFALLSIRFLAALIATWMAGECYAKSPLEIREVHIGWQGNYKAGHWTRIELRLQTAEPTKGKLTLLVQDGDGVPVSFGEEFESLEVGGSNADPTVLVRYFQAGTIKSAVRVRFTAENGEVWEENLAVPGPLPSSQAIVLSLGPEIWT